MKPCKAGVRGLPERQSSRHNKASLGRWLSGQKLGKSMEGQRWHELEAEQRADAISTIPILPEGWTLLNCVEFVRDHLTKTTEIIPLGEAIRRFLVLKGAEINSQTGEIIADHHSHVGDLNRRLRTFRGEFIKDPRRTTNTITKQEIEEFLAQYRNQNKINYRAALMNFFTHATNVGWAPENPLAKIKRPKVVTGRPNFLHVDEMAAMLHLAHEQNKWDLLAFLVMGGLLGCRPFDCYRIAWSGFKLTRKVLRIEAEWTKVRRPRVVPLNDPAVAWLALIPKGKSEETLVTKESTHYNRWRKWRKQEGFPIPWTRWTGEGADDILRHSCITHALPSIGKHDEARMARECGTSVPVIHDSYDGVLEEAQAWPYFQLRPGTIAEPGPSE